MAKEFEQMKFMKKMIDYMQEELIVSPLRASRLKKDIKKWWFTKTGKADELRKIKSSL